MNYFQIFCYCRVLKPNMAQPGPNFFRPVADCPCGKRRSSSSVSKSLAQRSLQKKADSCYRTQHLRSYIDLEDHVKIYLYFYTVSNRVNYVQKYIHFNTYICTNIDLPGFFFVSNLARIDWFLLCQLLLKKHHLAGSFVHHLKHSKPPIPSKVQIQPI